MLGGEEYCQSSYVIDHPSLRRRLVRHNTRGPEYVLTVVIAGEVPKPVVVDPTDVVLKVTGSTVCGSDLHLLHGMSMPFLRVQAAS